LADETGKAYGGHLEKGTVVFACELILETFDGPIFKRSDDEETGLSLWTMSE
jgi:predicted DNA-binding protein with PD1-like motif